VHYKTYNVPSQFAIGTTTRDTLNRQLWRKVIESKGDLGRSQWPHGLRCGSVAARLLGLWVRIPAGAWMPVTGKCCVLKDRGPCVGLITRPEESYWVWCVWVWSWILDNEEPLSHWGNCAMVKTKGDLVLASSPRQTVGAWTQNDHTSSVIIKPTDLVWHRN
jgi:hypothetical protein